MSADKIRVMLSSRMEDRLVPNKPSSPKLKTVNSKIQKDLEDESLLGDQLFEVFTSHLAPAKSVAGDVWSHSKSEVDRADIVLVLYNGRAGWIGSEASIGICHFEAMAAVQRAPERVRVIQLPEQDEQTGDDKVADDEFRSYLKSLDVWSNNYVATNQDEALEACRDATRDAVVTLATEAAQARRPGTTSLEMLEWSRLDFNGRAEAMKACVRKVLTQNTGKPVPVKSHPGTFIKWPLTEPTPILFQLHAIPAAMSVAAAREMVGQPFLDDYRLAGELKESVGPVHLVACQRGVTEAQAVRQLGFPDAFIVRTPFGVYVADPVQRIQMILIAGCDEPSTTRRQTSSMLKWLEQSGERELLAKRAEGRTEIVKAIAGLPAENP